MITVTPGLDKIPVYVKDGGIIPMGPALMHAPKSTEKVDIEVRYYGAKPGKYMLYDDDGETFNYERGAYSFREINISMDKNGKLSTAMSAPVVGKPNTIGKVTFKEMTADR